MRRRTFLASVGALAATLASRPARATEPRHLLVYWVKGGWDPTFVFDPHFGSAWVSGDPTAAAAEAGGIAFADAPSRPAVRDFFTTWGASTVVINGFSVGSISHDAGTRLLLTGVRAEGGEDLPTRIAAKAGADLAIPHAVLGGPSFPGADGGLVTRFDSTLLSAARGELPVPREDDRERRLLTWLEGEATGDDPQMVAWKAAIARTPALQTFAAGVTGPVDHEPARVGLVARLFAEGLSRTAILTGEIPPMTQWDSHINNQAWQDANHQNLFLNLDALCRTLSATITTDGASLWSRTRVLVLSEMGRQPTENAQGGKDHWPTTSMMLLGGDVRGGRTLGGTDDGLVARGLDRATGRADDRAPLFDPDALAATLAAGFDLDPEEFAPGAAGIAGMFG